MAAEKRKENGKCQETDKKFIRFKALARAVYNHKPIIVLDDILKGLDADTYSKCFTAILGPEGLLRKHRTAIVLATHNSA